MNPRHVPPHLLTGADRDAYLDAQWRPSPAFVGPVMPPMIAWQRAGEPGFPFHWGGGPYAEERTAIWGGKAPPVDIEWHRRVYDMNKHLADDLRIGRGVKAGCLFVN